MHYNTKQALTNYKGEPIRMTPDEKSPAATLGEVLEFVLVNANPEEFRSASDKHGLYKLLRKIHDAKPYLEVEAAEVELLKRAASLLPVVALGAIYDALESPVTPLKEVRRDGGPAPQA